MSGNHFLRSMAEPTGHTTETTADNGPTPEVHFSETVSVVTEVDNLAEAPLVDIPLQLTTADDKEIAKSNEKIRRSASRDRDMKDEEGLVLKAAPRDPDVEDAATEETAEVAEGVQNLDIAPGPTRKRKSQEEPTHTPPAEQLKQTGKVPILTTNGTKAPSKVRRGAASGKRRGVNRLKAGVGAENEAVPPPRRSKRSKAVQPVYKEI